MESPGFIHLHVHSAFSLLEGALPLGKLIDMAVADKQPALGIADTSNLFGALEFSEKASGKGLQPLVGCEIPLDFGDRDEGRGGERRPPGKEAVVLMAMNEEGFANLSELISRAYLESEKGIATIPADWLQDGRSGGLICLTGGPEGCIDPYIVNGQEAQAQARLDALADCFGDRLYVELQRHGLDREHQSEPVLIDAAYRMGLPLVATNEPYFPRSSDHEAHDALLAIAGSTVLAQTNRRKLSDQHYFKTRKEMTELFSDLPEALENTIEIARRVQFRPKTRDPILPAFTTGAAGQDTEQAEAEELARQAREGLDQRLQRFGLAPDMTRKDYDERLEYELGIIQRMKFPGYFLIVSDFIKWAKAHDIPVGPGRGSGAASVVAWSLSITDLDPLRYNLLFERFLNPERVSMPDFDIDFCQERREEVIGYVQNKYGADQVAQIITFGTLQARAVLRDVGRVLQMPYPQVDRICKLVPANPANPVTLPEAIRDEPKLQAMRDEDETVAELLEIGQKLEGLYRHASTHAAGIVIGDRPLQQLMPLYRDPRSDMPVTQYNLKWVEPGGLVKFDFLGLKTLTVIDYAVRMVNRDGGDFVIDDIPLDDADTYGIYQRGETYGIFQFESPGMRRALIDLKPDRIEDLIAMNALYRPGPMDNIPSFINRKHGREDSSVLHKLMEPILAETYGIIVYQEQVMSIAQDLSGYSLGEADLLRRAMGKKIKAEMDSQRVRFREGAKANNINDGLADTIFDLLAKFANYGFNKAHAAAYAYVSYQTAYLKAHHPREFLAASMTLDMGNTDKLNDFKREAQRLDIELVPPCVNRSEVIFSVKDGKVHYSLCAVKGVGRNVAESIVAARGDKPFEDLADFASRVDPKVLSKRTLETLINAGAFDTLVPQRERVVAVLDTIVATSQRSASARDEGIVDMFSADKPEPVRLPEKYEPWSPTEKLAREFSAIGFYLSAHPLDAYEELFAGLRVQPWSTFEKAAREGASAGRVAGTIANRQDRKTRRGSQMAIMNLSDSTGAYECVAFAEQLAEYGDVLEPGNSVILEVSAEARPDGVRLTLARAQPIEKAAERLSHRLTIFAETAECLSHIKALLKKGGDGTVSLVLDRPEAAHEYEIELPGGYRVSPEIASAIRAAPGVTDARLA